MAIDSKMEKLISDYIDNDFKNMIANLRRLVRIPSITNPQPGAAPYGQACKDVLDEYMAIGEEIGLVRRNYDYHMAELCWGFQEESLDIFSHLDVVPEGNGWTYPAFDVTIDKGCIIGRGTADDKGGTIAVLHAIKCLKDLNIPLKHRVRLIAGCNEENGMADIAYYLSKEPAPKFAFTPDVTFPVCIGEYGMFKTELTIPASDEGNLLDIRSGLTFSMIPDRATAVLKSSSLADLGDVDSDVFEVSETDGHVAITAKGLSAHASRSHEGRTAIKPLLSLLLERNLIADGQAEAARKVLALVEDNEGRVFGMQCADDISGPLMHICGMLWQEDGNFIVNCNIRYPITADRKALKTQFEEAVDHMGIGIHSFLDLPPCYVSPDDERVLALLGAYNHVTGKNERPVTTPGDTYARHLPCAVSFGPLWPDSECPLGPEYGAVHMPNECMTIREYKDMIKIYTIGIMNLDRVL